MGKPPDFTPGVFSFFVRACVCVYAVVAICFEKTARKTRHKDRSTFSQLSKEVDLLVYCEKVRNLCGGPSEWFSQSISARVHSVAGADGVGVRTGGFFLFRM